MRLDLLFDYFEDRKSIISACDIYLEALRETIRLRIKTPDVHISSFDLVESDPRFLNSAWPVRAAAMILWVESEDMVYEKIIEEIKLFKKEVKEKTMKSKPKTKKIKKPDKKISRLLQKPCTWQIKTNAA